MVILINILVMVSSFFIAYFVKDITTIINRNLILDSVSFFLARIVQLRLLLSAGLGICCSVQSMKARKPEKYFSTASSVLCCMIILFVIC